MSIISIECLFVNKSHVTCADKELTSNFSEFVFDSRVMAFSFYYLKILQLTLIHLKCT